MGNVFIAGGHEEIETAILLDNAKQCDLSKLSPQYADAVAFTDGKRVFINSDDRLAVILPDYNQGMLKWLLWHEEMHMKLKHHPRFFKYLKELKNSDELDEFKITKEEVNIIMDILVHDWMSNKFPELVPTAINNLAQFRDRNSLSYTFKTNTLEDMLDEYKRHKRGEDSETEKEEGEGESDEKKEDKEKKGHGESEKKTGKPEKKDRPEDGDPEIKDEEPEPEKESEQPAGHHDETDWSKLEDQNSTEFIDEEEGEYLENKINQLRNKKFKLARLTTTLNGLSTTKKERTYAVPSYMNLSKSIIMKGRRPGKTALFLCFDASGSMGEELATFKKIISESIPHAMDVPTTWFSGNGGRTPRDPDGRNSDYYKGKFKDIMPVWASSGYNDDGDRTIEMCWKAEQKGYSPIGVTDGGGQLSWSKEYLKQLKRTILVGQNARWLEECKKVNPNIQTLDI